MKKWRPPTEDEDGTVQFHVEHDDGDEEDLDEAGLHAAEGSSRAGLPQSELY